MVNLGDVGRWIDTIWPQASMSREPKPLQKLKAAMPRSHAHKLYSRWKTPFGHPNGACCVITVSVISWLHLRFGVSVAIA